MTLLGWMGALRGTKRRQKRAVREQSRQLLLRPSEFDHAAACERMRVDRNNSPLSILLVTLPREASRPEDVRFLAEVLAGRLRMTDTAGRLRDGRVGVLLPDTDESGAWKVASDVCELYEVGKNRPSCEVMVYPDQPPSDRGPRGGAPANDQGESVVVGDAVAPSAAESFFVRSSPVWKRAFDLVGASVGLVVAAPVIGAAAAAVVLTSHGGPFYVQEREGQGGRRFKIYKLRTMRKDADKIKHTLLSQSEQDGPAFKMSRDPRVTPVGRFLRKTSIDELPQLLNVIRGEMSLVGPRPLQVDESLACEPWQRQRLAMKPGLTCIWQVKGRSVVSFDEWVRMDLQYVRKAGLRTDLNLIAQTPVSLLISRGPR